ncbi:MAG: sigma-54-dependent Fis family transcriptional regulator [Bacteroidaceae bacterium]|nr:sigma-54-dependent Fis family transcriptional regulator [Bacteroidaceae bacterium]
MDGKEIQKIKLRFGIIGNSDELNRAIDIAMQVAHTDVSVLVTGESGVGKEHFPQIIHQNSARKHNKYIAVNCGAIPEGTIDSELFGHVKGAFTGAIDERNGYFAEANNGTIFLDEIGELPLSTQARLLRVLESGEYIKVGSSKVEKTNVRIVAATNVNLVDAIAKGDFREDLYYRLNTIQIKVPPLRERPADVPLLFRKFASDVAERYTMPSLQLADSAKQVLMAYSWPGNIRQLKNVAEQITLLSEQREITEEIVYGYLPEEKMSLPMLARNKVAQGKSFESEREILYQVLFELRQDVAELKRQVNSLMNGEVAVAHHSAVNNVSLVESTVAQQPTTISIASPKGRMRDDYDSPDVEDVEEVMSLENAEKDLIRKALIRSRGRRKLAAQELKISERTLYRKIKEYNLEDY